MVYAVWLMRGAVIQIIVKGVICLIVPNMIYLAAYYRMYEFKQTAALADKMLKGKATFLKEINVRRKNGERYD